MERTYSGIAKRVQSLSAESIGMGRWEKHIWVICAESQDEVTVRPHKDHVSSHWNTWHFMLNTGVVGAGFLIASVNYLEVMSV